jgi:hypothetical protein
VCYAVQRRRVRYLDVSLQQAFTKGLQTHQWAEGGLWAMETQLAELTPTKTWARTDTLKVSALFFTRVSSCCIHVGVSHWM